MKQSKEIQAEITKSWKSTMEKHQEDEHAYNVKMYHFWEDKYYRALNAGKMRAAHQAKVRLDYWIGLI